MRRILADSFFSISIKERSHRALLALAVMVFFFAVFDTLLVYALPLMLSERGFSKTELGLIIGSSSMAGAALDVFLSRILKNTDFRRMFLFVIAGCAGYFVLLLGANSVFTYLVAMAVWGLYWNFLSYGLYNFVGGSDKKEHASSWGILDVFKGLGLIVAPLIASYAIGERVGPPIFAVSWFFLCCIYLFYLLLLRISNAPHKRVVTHKTGTSSHSFWKVGKILAPVLLLNMLLFVFDLSFATIGPLISQGLKGEHSVGGLFLTLYYLPTILVLWIVGPVTAKYGKKRTSFIGFILGTMAVGSFIFVGKTPLLLPIVFISSVVSSLAWPSLKGCFADYIGESPEYEREIEILTSFFTNIGCVLGPVLAGFLADQVGDLQALSVIGFSCGVVALFVYKATPRKIHVA